MKPIMAEGILYIPMRAESVDGKIVGDAMIPIDKDHPDYEKWYEEEVADKCYGLSTILKGGPGSGNFGHSGRPGAVGGSGVEDARSMLDELSKKDKK